MYIYIHTLYFKKRNENDRKRSMFCHIGRKDHDKQSTLGELLLHMSKKLCVLYKDIQFVHQKISEKSPSNHGLTFGLGPMESKVAIGGPLTALQLAILRHQDTRKSSQIGLGPRSHDPRRNCPWPQLCCSFPSSNHNIYIYI